MYKVVCIASLKMLVINQNINYFENLAVPPIVLQTEKSAVDNPAELDEVINTLLSLRSNSVAVIGKDDVLNLLTGNTDKESFLNFIRYCDECISKVITGEVLSSNAVSKGTQALGEVHAEQKKITTEFDALTLAGGVSVILKRVLELNFGEAAPFEFSFDTNTETEEEKQVAVFKSLYEMGVEIPLEHLEKVFKIDGLTRRNLGENSTSSEPTELLQKSANLPKYLTNLEKELDEKDFKPISKDIKSFVNGILSECETYEEALNFIATNSSEFSFDELENELANAISNAHIKGSFNA